jgi:hypothetical protein
MWFDPYKALTELGRDGAGHSPANPANPARRQRPEPLRPTGLAELAGLAAPSDLDAETLAQTLDSFEERAAIREFDGGQMRAEAVRAALGETARAYGITPETLDGHRRKPNHEGP